MADYTAYFNGEWMPLSQVKIDPLDRGFVVGDTVFDVERTFNGKSFRMKEHIDRLYRSLKYARIDPGLSPDEMLDISEEAVRRNEPMRSDVGDYTVHQFITRGHGRRAWQAESPTVCVRVAPPPPPPPPPRLWQLCSPLRRRQACGYNKGTELLAGGAGPQDQALQQDELQPRGARGQRRRSRGAAHTEGRERESDGGLGVQRLPGYGWCDPHGWGPLHTSGRVPRHGL